MNYKGPRREYQICVRDRALVFRLIFRLRKYNYFGILLLLYHLYFIRLKDDFYYAFRINQIYLLPQGQFRNACALYLSTNQKFKIYVYQFLN